MNDALDQEIYASFHERTGYRQGQSFREQWQNNSMAGSNHERRVA